MAEETKTNQTQTNQTAQPKSKVSDRRNEGATVATQGTVEPTPAPLLQGTAGTIPEAPAPRPSLRDLLRRDLGFIPVILTLIVIVIYFQISDSNFLSAPNLLNLSLQIVRIGVLAIAAALILLLGEIDLSLAAVATACAAITVVLTQRFDWRGVPLLSGLADNGDARAWVCILIGVLAGAIMGLINGFFIAYLRVPSFIVTVAGSIAYAGVVLLVLNPQATERVRSNVILNLGASGVSLSPWWSFGLPIVGVVLYGGFLIWNNEVRRSSGLKPKSWLQIGLRLGGVVLVIAIVLKIFYDDSLVDGARDVDNRGVPVPFALLIGLIIFFWLLTTRTGFGRHIYAVGGNGEAARRAGINVVAMRIAVFSIASTLAAFGGILAASRGQSVASQIEPTLLLNAISVAVIGGVSLFGGRGSIWAVLLGLLVIGSLENGLTLLSQGQDIKNVVQGVVLLLAVTLDAVVRRNSAVKPR